MCNPRALLHRLPESAYLPHLEGSLRCVPLPVVFLGSRPVLQARSVLSCASMQRDADQSQRYVDEPHDQSVIDRRVTVAEAARILGISPEAVRARIQRGTLPKEKDPDGTVYVRLDAGRTRSNADGTSDGSSDPS